MTHSTDTLQAIRFVSGQKNTSRGATLDILDQLRLPWETAYIPVPDSTTGHACIANMQVRGAPAIAIVAILSLAVELDAIQRHTVVHLPWGKDSGPNDWARWIISRLRHLNTSRPTAVNLFEATLRFEQLVLDHVKQCPTTSFSALAAIFFSEAEAMLERDIQNNKAIGAHGLAYLCSLHDNKSPLTVLTHCNTGSLATAGHGTALGIVRTLHANAMLHHCYCTETRPYNQGSRLTAFELVHDGIPATLICDSMAASLCSLKSVSCIIVGADRIAANGDTANKIGTFALAIIAAHHKIPFIVAAPTTSIDVKTKTGAGIEIEVRATTQVSTLTGQLVDSDSGSVVQATIGIAAPGIAIWNPSFDVTPASLISAIVTERGVFVKDEGRTFFDLISDTPWHDNHHPHERVV